MMVVEDMKMNYRLIAISLLDGSLYDIAEFINYQSLIDHAKAITRWDIHCIAIELVPSFSGNTVQVLPQVQTGAH